LGAAALEERRVRRDLVAEDQLLRNVVDALRLALGECPDGCLEAALWHGVEGCFIARRVFDEAIDIMLDAGWACRRNGRLFGLPRRQRGL
jgi:hypothetical protein